MPLMGGERVVGVFGLLTGPLDDEASAPPAHLTPRQAQVLRYLEQGRSTKQIAQELHLSTQTVRNHVRLLLRGSFVSDHASRSGVAAAHFRRPGRSEAHRKGLILKFGEMTSQTSALMSAAGACGISRSELKTVSAARASVSVSNSQERMLDQLDATVDGAGPVGTLAPGHPLNKGGTVLLRHRRGLLFMALLDLDATNECIHVSSLELDGSTAHLARSVDCKSRRSVVRGIFAEHSRWECPLTEANHRQAAVSRHGPSRDPSSLTQTRTTTRSCQTTWAVSVVPWLSKR